MLNKATMQLSQNFLWVSRFNGKIERIIQTIQLFTGEKYNFYGTVLAPQNALKIILVVYLFGHTD